ncbi:hypothetical protein TrLO_g14911 [Triparma laevis f. longispina]|uniref:EF-hand domain-containing protein n=1 Tax=Triparma laevis f. longispina TaxID=1714387 RepID=A0A9W7AR00_9STRA|nr:hypothetical protein TrLO_g14911 [Triparma laevis f. longispina]
MVREDLPFTSVKIKAKSLTYMHNREAPFTNKICHRENVDRGFKIHKEKLKRIRKAKPTAQTMKPMKFLEDAISKSFKASEENKQIMRENQALVKKLMRISGKREEGGNTSMNTSVLSQSGSKVGSSLAMASEANTTTTKPKLFSSTSGPDLKKFQAQRRQRIASKISRENLAMLKRLNAVRPEYSVSTLRKQRKKESTILKLRRTNYTVGHILSQPLEPIRTSKQRSLAESSFQSAATAAIAGPEPNPPTHIYVDPEALKHLPKSKPGSRRTTRPKGRKKTPETKTRPHPTFNGHSKRTSRSPSPVEVKPRHHMLKPIAVHADEASVNSMTSKSTTAASTVFTKAKDFNVFGFDKDVTSDCVVEVLMRDPWDGMFLVRVISKKQGLLSGAEISHKDAAKVEAWCEANINGAQDMLELSELLSGLFMEADQSGTGSLKYEEFIRCMEKADLGIEAHELRLVMAEADDNDDGVIDYDEFVPIAIDLIQAFKARAHARRKQQDQDAYVDEEALKMLYTDDLETTVKFLLELLHEVDNRNSGSVTRQEFKQCLNNPGTGLTKVEAKMIENEASRDKFGRIQYKSISEVVFKVRLTTIKNAIIETQASDIQKYIMDMCRDQERDDSGDDNIPDSEFPYTGQLTDRKIANLLQSANMLSLNRLQVLAIMCEADVIDGMVDYWKFVPTAAKAIENMFEPTAIAQRANLLEQSNTSDEALMQGRQREEVEDMVRKRFKASDVDGDGWLNPQEFSKCLESLELGLSKSEINALMTAADLDGNGFIDLDEFVQLAYDQLLYLEREKHIRELQSTVINETNLLMSPQHARTRAASISGVEEDTADENAVTAMEEMLIKLFTKADFNHTGYLTANEFREILDSLDLGVTSFQQTILMAEADENEDGKIQYGEFVPVCAELLQAFKAKASAEKDATAKENEINDQVKLFVANNKNQLKLKINSMIDSFSVADKNNTKSLSRSNMVSLLRSNPNLEKSEVNMILHSIPHESNGESSYNNIEEIMQEVFFANIKRKYEEEVPHSSLESHIVQMLEDEEKSLRKEEEAAMKAQKEADGGSSSSVSLEDEKMAERRKKEGGLESLDFDDDDSQVSVLSMTAGFLPANRVFNALKNAKHLRLSRVQLLAVMSLAGVDESSADEVPYRHFATIAAEMITKFYDPREIKRRALLEKRTDMNPLKLLNGLGKDDMVKRLTDKLTSIDGKGRGNVSEEIFKQVLQQCLDQCDLTKSDFSSLLTSAKRNSAGRIIWKPFVDSVYSLVLTLKRERHLHEGLGDLDESSENSGLGNDLLLVPPSKKEVEGLTKALYTQINLESRRGELTIHFSEDTGAALTSADTGGMKNPANMPHKSRKELVQDGQQHRSRSMEFLEDSKKSRFLPRMLAKVMRPVLCVDREGKTLAVNKEIWFPGVKGDGGKMWMLDLNIGVSTQYNVETGDDDIKLLAEGSGYSMMKVFKMPSLAIADEEAAIGFAENIAENVKIVKGEEGGDRFKF